MYPLFLILIMKMFKKKGTERKEFLVWGEEKKFSVKNKVLADKGLTQMALGKIPSHKK